MGSVTVFNFENGATCVFLGTRMPPVKFFGGDPGTRAPLIAATNGLAGWLPRVRATFLLVHQSCECKFEDIEI